MNRSAVIELDDDDGNMELGVGEGGESITRHPAELHGAEDIASGDEEAGGGGVQDGLMDAMKSQMADTVSVNL